MKFTLSIAVVMLALAMGAQSSLLPLATIAGHGHGLSYTAVSGPAVVAHGLLAHGLVGVHHGVHHGDDGQYHGEIYSHDDGQYRPHIEDIYAGHHGLAVAHAAHIPAAVHVAPHVVHHEGTYVAQTRGAVHTAPLAGHVNSAASINVAPAPGTV